jgi:hypothetical protein
MLLKENLQKILLHVCVTLDLVFGWEIGIVDHFNTQLVEPFKGSRVTEVRHTSAAQNFPETNR